MVTVFLKDSEKGIFNGYENIDDFLINFFFLNESVRNEFLQNLFNAESSGRKYIVVAKVNADDEIVGSEFHFPQKEKNESHDPVELVEDNFDSLTVIAKFIDGLNQLFADDQILESSDVYLKFLESRGFSNKPRKQQVIDRVYALVDNVINFVSGKLGEK